MVHVYKRGAGARVLALWVQQGGRRGPRRRLFITERCMRGWAAKLVFVVGKAGTLERWADSVAVRLRCSRRLPVAYAELPRAAKQLLEMPAHVCDGLSLPYLPGMETNGFSFEGTDFAGMDYALNRALSVWYSDKGLWHSLRRRAMQQVRGVLVCGGCVLACGTATRGCGTACGGGPCSRWGCVG